MLPHSTGVYSLTIKVLYYKQRLYINIHFVEEELDYSNEQGSQKHFLREQRGSTRDHHRTPSWDDAALDLNYD